MELCSPLCFISSLMTFVKNLPFFRYILTQRIDQSDFHFQSGLLFITEQKCISHPGQCQARLASPNMMLLLMRSYSIHAFSEVANSQSLSIDTMNSEVIYGSCAASQKAEVVFFILKQCLPHCLSWGKQLTFIGLATCMSHSTGVSEANSNFFYICVFISTIPISTRVHIHLTSKDILQPPDCYNIKCCLNMEKHLKWGFLRNHHRRKSQRISGVGSWKKSLRVI